MNTKNLFKLFSLAFIIVFLAACNGGNNTVGGVSPTSNPTNTPANTLSNSGDPAVEAKAVFETVYAGKGTSVKFCSNGLPAMDSFIGILYGLKATVGLSTSPVETNAVTFTTTNQSDNTADVQVGGTLRVIIGEEIKPLPLTLTMKMKNENGWKFCDYKLF
jgi:hypothetical protein